MTLYNLGRKTDDNTSEVFITFTDPSKLCLYLQGAYDIFYDNIDLLYTVSAFQSDEVPRHYTKIKPTKIIRHKTIEEL